MTGRSASFSAGLVCRSGKLHTDDVHHSEVLMVENVAVKNKVADVGPAEIDERRYAGKCVIWIPVPRRNLNHIQVLAGHSRSLRESIDFEIVLGLHEKVKLVEV